MYGGAPPLYTRSVEKLISRIALSRQYAATSRGHRVFRIQLSAGLSAQREGEDAAAVFNTMSNSCSRRAFLSPGKRISHFWVFPPPLRDRGMISQIFERSSRITEPSLPVAPVRRTRGFFNYTVFSPRTVTKVAVARAFSSSP